MPAVLEAKLKREALKRFKSTTSPKARAYIFGTMRNTGWRPSREQTQQAMTRASK